VTEDRLVALERRVTAIEETLARPGDAVPRTTGTGSPRTVDPDTFWALDGLAARMPGAGAVMIVGQVALPDGRSARWQEGATTTDLLDDEWDRAAESLAALAHPVRLRLVRAVLRAPTTARDLSELDGMGTSGQVYHHLRQLVAAGWLRARGGGARGGGRFEVPAERVIPLLTTVLGGRR
jgi:DNA-binding transcriptional ArsR family regulator